MTSGGLLELYESALRESLGLDEQQFRRLSALVGLHTHADRLLSVLLATSTATSQIKADDTKAARLLDAFAELSFWRRLELAQALGLVTPEHGASLAALNKVRNMLLHGKSKTIRSLDTIPEIVNDKRFTSVLQKGTVAVIAIDNFTTEDVQ